MKNEEAHGGAVTVEDVLRDLRSRFPNERIWVEVSVECYGDNPSTSAKIVMPGRRFTGATLSEALAAATTERKEEG